MKCSVVVPVYKAKAYLDECVKSILNQTFKDFELLLIDDGSPDECPEMCDDWAAKDERIKVIHKENGGPQSAVKAGVLNSCGEYCCFVDSDDWVSENYIETLINEAEDAGADLVQCGFRQVFSNSEIKYCVKEKAVFDSGRVIVDAFFTNEKEHSILPLKNARYSKIYKTEILKSIICDVAEDQFIGEDLMMNLLYLYNCNKVTVIPDQCNYFYRQVNTSIMNYYDEKKVARVLYMVEGLCSLADKLGYNRPLSEKDTQISLLILDVLMSLNNVGFKYNQIKKLKALMTDIDFIDKLADVQPIHGKISLLLVRHNIIFPVCAIANIYLKITSIFRGL